MNTNSKIINELNLIKQRNSRVELDKKWETSKTRKIIIAILTYLIMVIFMKTIKVSEPFINAIIPTIGFILSTLSLEKAKKIWIKKFLKK